MAEELARARRLFGTPDTPERVGLLWYPEGTTEAILDRMQKRSTS